jgi:hypothetical protein
LNVGGLDFLLAAREPRGAKEQKEVAMKVHFIGVCILVAIIGRLVLAADESTPKSRAAPAKALAKAETEDCLIQVADVQIDLIPLKNSITETITESEEKYMMVLLVVSNLSEKRKIDYQGGGFNRFISHATMRDDLGNSYKAVTFGIDNPAIQKREVSIYPGKSVSDLYVFEVPIAAAKTLTMTIKGEVFGSKDEVKLIFPVTAEKRESETEKHPSRSPGSEPAPAKRQPAPKQEPVKRTWTDATGNYKVEAEYRGIINGMVILKKKDGKIIKLPMEKLSEQDQKWLKQLGKQK